MNISKNAYFGDGRKVSIGDNSGLGPWFKCQNTILKIGIFVMTRTLCLYFRGDWFDRVDIPIGCQETKPKSYLEINDDIWIGARVTILGNVQK